MRGRSEAAEETFVALIAAVLKLAQLNARLATYVYVYVHTYVEEGKLGGLEKGHWWIFSVRSDMMYVPT